MEIIRNPEALAPLTTERLLLHPLTVAEAERIVAKDPATHDRWAEGYPAEGDMAGARGFLDRCGAQGDPGVFRAYEIRRREDGLAVGGIGFHGPPDGERFVTVGYGLTPSVRGRGYATEALRALLACAREQGAAGAKGDADLGNVASQRVMEAAGMRYVGEDERLRHFRVEFAPKTQVEFTPAT
ncbi:GNAT family N-acetyltransferase [Streptomyces sp. ISL-36]|uniref:GNAT family N-acetyltransferase n=1 Tax=Streptomyces sp. ISL-36 TaxID=2819182 RepID=UPI001BE724BB|nr:GNAT family N-acetyltransferase [Streptomyces sp. ISL-36]MBT2445033.1 GNAT family N-acetyltransferase [Streptomyces sp. ISL-36]